MPDLLDLDASDEVKAMSAKILAEYLMVLSDYARAQEWHVTGIHLMVAAEKLENMLSEKQVHQDITSINIKPST